MRNRGYRFQLIIFVDPETASALFWRVILANKYVEKNMTENFQSKSARTLHIYINISTA